MWGLAPPRIPSHRVRLRARTPAFVRRFSRHHAIVLGYRERVFGLGGWEIAVLGVAALIFFGPQKLPQLMRQAGKIMREVRKASFEFQNSLEREFEDDPYRKAHRREKKIKQKADELGMSVEELEAQLKAAKEARAGAPPAAETAPAPVVTPPATNGNGNSTEPPPSPMPAAADVKTETDPKPDAG